MTEQTSWLQVVAIPAAIAAIPGAIQVWKWWTERGDKREAAATDRNMTAGERREAALIAERAALTVDQREQFDRVEAERDRAVADAERERARRIVLERDRDRGWELARFWYRLAHDLSHALKNARAIANGICGRMDPPQPPPEWVPFDVPVNLEDPADPR